MHLSSGAQIISLASTIDFPRNAKSRRFSPYLLKLLHRNLSERSSRLFLKNERWQEREVIRIRSEEKRGKEFTRAPDISLLSKKSFPERKEKKRKEKETKSLKKFYYRATKSRKWKNAFAPTSSSGGRRCRTIKQESYKYD